ncbi:MAG: CBS domain-containing protein [Candidatus Cloacimonetes bacterium]|nr:CBS domain-containing protein [Candidatus Cloacimonadota bacterium]MDD2544371.1 CBS domain-containing protein [Candidatus Cloacimonadota bacterium]MDD3097309.1 CBS domain-containing protein [Candidatus Cloacimonadota bacterium]MDD4034216.1 CBS domain-containing protein [Candidatus Cloacimonadota bacterium]MDD4667692.1 CBS domain-containing protein [Candidatus Cloacimonadota bacterium]
MMLLSNLLDAKSILHESRILSKEQVYRLLVERICHHRKLPICGEGLVQLILQRDSQSSTAYPTGIAIPHIRMEDFHDTVIGMAFLQNPIDYEGTKVEWVCLVITDKSSSNIYLNLVAALLKLSKDAPLIRELGELRDGHAVVQRLHKMEIQIKREITLGDIMISEPITISADARLSELGAIFSSRGLTSLPVVDNDNRYLGEVNILHLLKVGVPDYLMMLDNVSFLRSYEPLEKLFEQEDTLTVREIMSRDEEYLNPDTSIPEVVFEMIQHHKRFFSVVDDSGKLVGVVTASDIFRKVIKA